MDECSVCAEKYNKSTRNKIVCPKCSTEVCKECVMKYLLGLVGEFVCMSCKKPWTTETLLSLLPKTLVHKNLSQHRRAMICDLETARLPELQTRASAEKRYRIIARKEKTLREKVKKLQTELRELKTQRIELNNARFGRGDAAFEEHEEKVSKTIACPLGDCRGFATKYVCGLCQKKICRKCMKEKTEDHECDPDDVESIKVIRSQSKPCPKCGVAISRVSGCRQMWCVACKTPFDWETGNIVRGHVHNPHYVEWMERRGRTGNAPECGEVPYLDEVIVKYDLPPCLKGVREEILDCANVRIEESRDKINKAGMDYLLEEISKDVWEERIVKETKKNEFNHLADQIRELYGQAGGDLLRRLGQSKTKGEAKKIYKEISELREYVQEQQCKLRDSWNMRGNPWQIRHFEGLLPKLSKLVFEEVETENFCPHTRKEEDGYSEEKVTVFDNSAVRRISMLWNERRFTAQGKPKHDKRKMPPPGSTGCSGWCECDDGDDLRICGCMKKGYFCTRKCGCHPGICVNRNDE